jgi:hypothetical protein
LEAKSAQQNQGLTLAKCGEVRQNPQDSRKKNSGGLLNANNARREDFDLAEEHTLP